MHFNPSPRSFDAVGPLLGTTKQFLKVIDVGASSGPTKFMKHLQDHAITIGFEPVQPCEQLNEQFPGNEFYPYALHGADGTYPFHVTKKVHCCGFAKSDPWYKDRFSQQIRHDVVKVVDMEAISLSTFFKKHDVGDVDFIKVDTEGTELPILEGGADELCSKGVLGVLSEVWSSPAMKGTPSFGAIDRFMLDQGFFLFDIDFDRSPRTTLPLGILGPPTGPKDETATLKSADGTKRGTVSLANRKPVGQPLAGDVLYLRDPIYDLKSGETNFVWTTERILKLICIADAFHHIDYALELVDTFETTLLDGIEADHLRDALVPPLPDGTIVPYADYKFLSDKIYEAVGYDSSYRSSWT